MASPEPLRAFFAVPLPGPVREVLAAAIETLRAEESLRTVRFVDAPSLHLTLRFLGALASDAVAPLVARVDETVRDLPAFPVALEGIEWFPARRRPRVVVVRVTDSEALTTLAARVEAAVVAEGFEPEARRFRGHVTLGRVRGRLGATPRLPADAEGELPVERIVLYRSEPGRRYTPLGEARLV